MHEFEVAQVVLNRVYAKIVKRIQREHVSKPISSLFFRGCTIA